tara:strand:- start:54580 stop:55131 length:552 start_codon:yes stop_codon:yes gene_type:complete
MKFILFLLFFFGQALYAQPTSVFDKLMNDPEYLKKFFKKDFLDKMQNNNQQQFRDLLNDDDLFHSGFLGQGGIKSRWVKEKDKYILVLEGDNFNDDELNFEINDNVIVIKGTLVTKVEKGGMKSISSRSFSRSELIPDKLDPSSADFKKTKRGIEISFAEYTSGNSAKPKKVTPLPKSNGPSI